MRKLSIFVLTLLLCSCTLSRQLTSFTAQDAQDALHNAQVSDDPAAIQCFASKLVVAERASQLKVSGGLSALAAKRAFRKWSAEVQKECSEVIVDGLAWVRMVVPGGL